MEEITVIPNQELLIYRRNGAETKYRIFQIYGQKYIKMLEPPSAVPDRWSEVYVSNIPRSMPIEEVFKFFARRGAIYQLRLLMDFSGCNRGHCFVHFVDVEASRWAICCLHGTEIAPGCRVIIKLSLNNNQLIIKNIPAFISVQFLQIKIRQVAGEGLTEVTLRPSRTPAKNYCFCTYRDHQFAVKAHKKIWPYLSIEGYMLGVNWAVPEILRFSTNLYFTNFPIDMTKEEFFAVLKSVVNIKSILHFRIDGKVGFITFVNHMHLCLGESSLKGFVIRQHVLVVSRVPVGDGQHPHKKHDSRKYCHNCNYVHPTPTNIRSSSCGVVQNQLMHYNTPTPNEFPEHYDQHNQYWFTMPQNSIQINCAMFTSMVPAPVQLMSCVQVSFTFGELFLPTNVLPSTEGGSVEFNAEEKQGCIITEIS